MICLNTEFIDARIQGGLLEFKIKKWPTTYSPMRLPADLLKYTPSRLTLLLSVSFLPYCATCIAVAQSARPSLSTRMQYDKGSDLSTYQPPVSQAKDIAPRSATTIPVVVHVIWQNAAENISDAQIQSQIEALNQDYRATNAEIDNIHPLFANLVADMELEFCLVATRRRLTTIPGIYNQLSGGRRRVCHSDLGGSDAVDPEHYLNIWLSDRSDNALGSATAPGEAPEGEDGVFMPPRYFGTMGTVSAPYNLGRTATHETGHYFGLLHPWGPGLENDNNCSGDDGIADTPLQFGTYRNTCPPFPMSSCGSPDMHPNFMNYTDDACMALFTPGQKAVVTTVLQQERPGLVEQDCMPLSIQAPRIVGGIPVYPNPCKDELWITLPSKEIDQLTIFDVRGRLVGRKKGINDSVVHWVNMDLSSGVYILQALTERGIYLQKLVVSK